MARIYVCGEALIDFVPDETRGGERCFVPRPGGSPMNAAKAAAKAAGQAAGQAGTTAEFLGALSTDFLGQMLRDDLVSAGAGVDLATVSERPASLAFVDLSQGSPRYAFHFEGTADEDMAPSIPQAPEVGDIVHVGSISLVGPAARRIVEFAVEEGGRRLLSLDPNVRDTVIGDRDEWQGRIDRLIAAASIVKLSDEDLDYMRPGQAPEAFAKDALARGPKLVIVSGGEGGATAWTAAGHANVRAPRVEVADTVGAGDTLMGSTLAWLAANGVGDRDALGALDTDRLTAMLRFATAAAAINCTRSGCVPPSRAEIEAFLAERGQ